MNVAFSLALISSALLFVQQCENDDFPEGTPECVQARITEIRKDEVWNPPAEVYRYLYDGRTVYFIPQRCCDIPSQLYNEGCNLICEPDGGLSGNGDGKCPDFFSARSGELLIWEDERK